MAGSLIPTRRRGLLSVLSAPMAVMPLAVTASAAQPDRHVEWLRDFFEARWQLDNSEAPEDSEEYLALLAEYERLDDLVRYTPAVTREESFAQLCYLVDLGRICELREEELIRGLRSTLPHLGIRTWRRS